MSLILDALRKSEAERRRGQSPGLFSTSDIRSPVSRPRLRWWQVGVFVVLMLASGWVVWNGRTQRALDDLEPASAPAGATVAADAGRDDRDPGNDATEIAAAAADRDPVGSPPVQATAASAPPIAAPASPTAASADPADASVAPASAPPPASPPPVASVATNPRNVGAPTVASPRAPIASPAFPPVPAPTAEAPAEEALPSLAVLDSITRGTLPPLKLSMHVWGQEPGKRFAIVDGQRVAEGSLLGNGVVEQIRRDGVVINVNGQRLLLPKP